MVLFDNKFESNLDNTFKSKQIRESNIQTLFEIQKTSLKEAMVIKERVGLFTS